MAQTRPPPSTFPPAQQQQQQQQQRQLHRMPSAREIVSSTRFVSPLAKLEAEGRSARSRANSASTATGSSVHTNNSYQRPSQPVQQAPAPPPVPALELNNLFRASSRYSVDSLSSQFSTDSYGSYNTISQEGGQDEEEEEEASTPKATTFNQADSYFEIKGSKPSSPEAYSERSRIPSSNSGNTTNAVPVPSLTPKRSFSVTSRRPPQPQSAESKPPLPLAHQVYQQRPPFQLGAVPARGRERSASDAHTRDVPAAQQPEETEVAADWASMRGEQGSDWGDDESQFEWVDTEGAPEATNGVEGQKGGLSPSKRLSKLKAVMVGGHDEKRKLRKPLVIHRRAPPPPPNTAPAMPVSEPNSPVSRQEQSRAQAHMLEPRPAGLPQRSGTLRTASDSRPPFVNRATDEPKYYPPRHDVFRPPQAPFASTGRGTPNPLMVPLKGDGGPSSPMNRPGTRNSNMSFQSVAYSFYDLDGDHSSSSPSTPKADGELVFPHGKYVKVSASTLDKEREMRERTVSEPTRGSGPDDFIHAGIEARGKGDLAKSAWYFMKAAEGGSATGRMYWGLALRHGWGVARDDRRAFVELRQACDDSLAKGGLDFHRSPGASRLTSQQKKNLTNELAVGLFEVGNCFLEGVGVKKAPEVALAYLKFAANMGDIASQEQLGFIYSKGSNGIKKDMKEAAKWYRMAIGQGSTNTFGLAWIWKDKYMS